MKLFFELSLCPMNATDREILHIALPAIVSNITVPLLSLTDVTIAGHLDGAASIGAIAVGGMLFNILYWLFGFLRMGTGGLTAQACGRGDHRESMRLLMRSLTLAWTAGLLFIVLQEPLCRGALALIRPTPEVAELAAKYFHICIWGAPAMLSLYSLAGWFLGMQNARYPMYVAIGQNVVNIAASLGLVIGLDWKVEGVATGTLIAQYAGLLLAVGLWMHRYGMMRRYLSRQGLWQREALQRFFAVNRDIFLRTLCLVGVTLYFTSAGARQGDITLAVNALLMQFFTLFSYVMDGFAYAGEALGGRHIGACNRSALSALIRRLFLWGGIMAVFFTLCYVLGGTGLTALLTDQVEVRHAAEAYLPWVWLIPLAGVAAFLWDGVYIGATATRAMLLSMAGAVAVFFLLIYIGVPRWGNHALWLAFVVYLALRGVIQTLLGRRVLRRSLEDATRLQKVPDGA